MSALAAADAAIDPIIGWELEVETHRLAPSHGCPFCGGTLAFCDWTAPGEPTWECTRNPSHGHSLDDCCELAPPKPRLEPVPA